MNNINQNNFFLLHEIIKKNFAAKYKDSILGIIWSVLRPLLIMILLTIIFSTLFGRNIDNYPVYFLSGKCIYDFFSSSTTVSLNAIKGNKTILKSTAAPKHIFILGGVISEFINYIITLIILALVMYVTNAQFYFNTIPFSIIPLISLFILSLGIGFMLSIICVYYTDIQHLWGVITMMLMYASAVFYPMEIIPEPFHRYMLLNPLFWTIDQFRHFALWGTVPETLNMINLFIISLIILVLGIIIYKKYEKKVTMKF